MRTSLILRASQLSSTSTRQASRYGRAYATRSGLHPSDSIPVKGALPISTRTLYRIYIYGSGTLVGAYLAYRSLSKSSTPTPIELEPAWSTFTLESKDAVSPTAAVFTLKNKRAGRTSSHEYLFQNAIWAVDVQQPQLQIVREYTPVPPAIDSSSNATGKEADADLHLLIREEYKGEVSGYLHRLPLGANVEVSKPYAQINLAEASPDNMVFVVGGTGITTALQAIHALIETKKNSLNAKRTFIHILWANRRREDCLGGISDIPPTAVSTGSWSSMLPTWLGGSISGSAAAATVSSTELGKSPIVDELRRLKGTYQDQIKVDYFVDEEGTFITPDHVAKAIASCGSRGGDSSSSSSSSHNYVALSGPDGFMTNLAGESRNLKNKISGPPSSGALAQVKNRDWRLMVLG